jgi:hypothetical protein
LPFYGKRLLRCITSTISICPLESTIYDKQDLPVPPVYSFRNQIHSDSVSENCLSIIRRPLLYDTIMFGSTIFQPPRKLTICCPGGKASPPHSQILVNAGLLFNATAYHISTEDLQIYLTLRGSRQTKLDVPQIFLPHRVPIISQHESHQLRELTPPTLQVLDNLNSRLATTLHSMDVDSLFHMHKLLTEFSNAHILAHNCYYLNFCCFTIRTSVYFNKIALRKS